jgi:hypothetical protein
MKDDIKVTEVSAVPKKAKTVNLTINLKNLIITIVAIVILLLVFWLGWHFGENHQINKEQTNGVSGIGPNPGLVRHRALVGSVSKVSSSSITVVQSGSAGTQSAAINQSTVIRNTKGQTITANSVKTGTRAIVTAEVNSNNSLTAQNILIIQ